MDFKTLKNGDKLKINSVEYEVLYAQEESDIAKEGLRQRLFVGVYLHRVGDKMVIPTHKLAYYPDSNDSFFIGDGSEKKLDLENVKIEIKKEEGKK